jgi:hypothetical protein
MYLSLNSHQIFTVSKFMSRLVSMRFIVLVGVIAACSTVNAELVSYWPFEEGVSEPGLITFDATDDNDGTLGATAMRAPGLVGVSAVRFDNTNSSFINMGPGVNDTFATTTGISVEALIVPMWTGNMGDYDEIFRKEDGGNRILFSFQNDAFGSGATPPVDPGPVLSFGLNIGGAYEELDMPLGVNLTGLAGGSPTSGTVYLTDPGVALGPNDVVLGDGNAHHVVAAYDDPSGEKSLYVDGVLRWRTIAANQGIMSGGTAPATIGNIGPNGGEPFNGVIDEVAFYNHALSAADVTQHFNHVKSGVNYFGVQPPTPPSQMPPTPNLPDPGNLAGLPENVISYWDFDEAAGPVAGSTLNFAYDRKGAANGAFEGTATRTEGIVGQGAAEFDNMTGTAVNVGNGGTNNVFSVTSGIAIEAAIVPAWSGEVGDYDEIFRKEDGGNRILFSFQNDAFGTGAVVPVDPGPALSLGLNIGGAYGELDMPLGVDLASLPGGNAESGTIHLQDPGMPLGANDVVLRDGEAHHVLAQHDSESGEMAIYIDGKKRWSFAHAPGSLIASGGSASAFIGSTSGAENFTGVIDELAIWNRALSQAEIDQHVANVFAGMRYFSSSTGSVGGDYNGNGIVDAADYLVWRNALGQNVTAGTGADGDGDGTIGTGDYDFWRGRFGNTSASGIGSATGTVPEPGALALVVAMVLTLVGARSRRS